MDSLSPVLDGFGVVLEPTNLLYCLIGVVIGMLIGVLPGLGPAATIAILLPLTIGLEPVTSIIMLAGIYYGAQYGGTITSVLLPSIGFEIPAVLLCVVWLRFLGGESWRSTIVISLVTTAAFYLLFLYALGIPLPHLFAF